MAIRRCAVVAIEGTHASGKTTLMHALTAYYRAAGVHATCVGEPARTSPFVEEVVVHGAQGFDLDTEVDLFAAQISEQLRAARRHSLLITDKTIVNVVTYAHLLLDGSVSDGTTTRVLRAMDAFCRAWAYVYDAVLLCCDRFVQDLVENSLRARVVGLQDAVADRLVRDLRSSGLAPEIIPTGLDTARRVAWAVQRIDELKLLTRVGRISG